MNKLQHARPLRALSITLAAIAAITLVPTAAHATTGDAPDTTERIPLVVERQADVYMPFDLRSDGAVVASAGMLTSFEGAASRAATVTAPAVGETGQVTFENGKCLQAFGPNGNGWTIVSNSCDAARTLWTRTESGALRVTGTPARALEYFGNANTITARAVTGFEYPVGIAPAR
jgi:hypothetical protein